MKIYSVDDGSEVSGTERTETHRRDWEIRRRVKGTEEWHTFATFEPETWWLEVKEVLEYWRKQQPPKAKPGVEYAVFEIMTRRIETRRKW
jgi:hypothetical protein